MIYFFKIFTRYCLLLLLLLFTYRYCCCLLIVVVVVIVVVYLLLLFTCCLEDRITSIEKQVSDSSSENELIPPAESWKLISETASMQASNTDITDTFVRTHLRHISTHFIIPEYLLYLWRLIDIVGEFFLI